MRRWYTYLLPRLMRYGDTKKPLKKLKCAQKVTQSRFLRGFKNKIASYSKHLLTILRSWRAAGDSNPRPQASEACTLSS